MQLRHRFFALVFIIGYIFIAGSLFYLKTEPDLKSKQFRPAFRQESFVEKNETDFRPFIYLTQTERCLPLNLNASIGDNEACNCDVIVLSYKEQCQELTPSHVAYVYDPQSTWSSGRNTLYFTALNRTPGYHYYIFLDDDVTLTFNDLTPPEMKKMQPIRAIEEWLLDYEPAVGVLDYAQHSAKWTLIRRKLICGVSDSSLVLPVVWFDAIFHAFHYKAVAHILPYSTQHDKKSWWMSALRIFPLVELKFRGQALLFAAVTAKNPKHRQYPRDAKQFDDMWRIFVEEIQQQAPAAYKNRTIFKALKEQLARYTLFSSTYCLKVSRHLPIVPYAHFDRETSSKERT